MPLYQLSCDAGHLWVNLGPRFTLLTAKIPYMPSKTTCMPDTFRNVWVGCAAGLPDPHPTEIINPGLGRQIAQYHIKWFALVNSLSFSIHQINMYMPSTAKPKPYPTSVQKAGPKIWTMFRQKWLKKTYPFGHTCLFSRTTQANRLPNKHLALLTLCQFLPRPSMFGHFSSQL